MTLDTHDIRYEAAAVLRDAWTLISDPAHWTQGTSARDVTGKHTYAADELADAWCAIGAYYKAVYARFTADINPDAHIDAHRLAHETLLAAARHLRPDPTAITRNEHGTIVGDASIAKLNDTGDHEDVGLMYKHAIGALEQ